MPKLIDRIAPVCDVAESHVAHIAAPPEAVVAALNGFDVSGLIDLPGVEIDPVPLVHDLERVHRAAWRPDPGRPGVVLVAWDLHVEPDGDEGSYLATSRRFIATTPAARERLLGAWGNVQAVVAGITSRLVATVAEHSAPPGEDLEALLAVG